jgi:hypothetical protein
MHFIFIYTLNVTILDETLNYEALHYQCSHSHVLHFILGLNTGVPFTGSPCKAAVTGCPGGCRRLCDKADIVNDNATVLKKRPNFLNSAPTKTEGALRLRSAPSDRF